MDGYEATRRIRASDLQGAATVPIIAMTANVFREDVERCFACGMNSHIGKPIEITEVIARLHEFLPKAKKNESVHHSHKEALP
jgi:CheY-like chemotaxis protein